MTTAAVLLFGTANASAQEDTPSAPTETTTAPPTEPTTTPPSETPPSTETPTPPSETPTSEPQAPATPSETPKPKPDEPKVEQPKQEEAKKPEAKAPEADLKVAVAFDKAQYEAGADIGITVTVTNVGTAAAQDVRFATETSTLWLRSGYEQLGSRPALGPGEHKTYQMTAASRYIRNNYAEFLVRAYRDGIVDPTPGNNESRATAEIKLRQGTVSGVLYTDHNGNGKADAGEGVPNTYIQGEGGSPRDYLSARTDADGRFTSYPAMTGRYVLRLDELKLTPRPGEVVITEGQDTRVDLAVVPTTMNTLRPTVEFDRDTYGKGDQVSVKVTLTNTGQTPLTGVVALCDSIESDWYLKGTGPGWAPLSPDGPGVTIGAGQTTVVTVTDVVPEAAYRQGQLGVGCNFGNNGRNPYGTVGASDFARVEGAFGTVRGTVFDQEHNRAPDNARIVALDPATRRPIAGANAFSGKWEFTGLPEGDVVLQVVGRWKHADGGNGLPVKVLGGKVVTADLVVVPGPDVPDPTDHKPDLALTASFDKPSYDVYDEIELKVKIANVGTGYRSYGGYLDVEYLENAVDYDQEKLRSGLNATSGLWPGESREVTVVGKVRPYSTKNTVAFKARLTLGDNNPANDKVDISAVVTYGVGDLSFTVYGDSNDNGKLDAGEELPGRKINAAGGAPYSNVEGVSDASGKIAFRGLSAGRYYVNHTVAENDRWVPETRSSDVYVTNKADTPVQLRMVRPLTDELEARLAFGRDTYQPGEEVQLFVTVQNNGDEPLRVKATCGYDPPPYHLTNNNEKWGDWIYNGPGYVVEPHSTVNIVVRDAMPKASPDHGLVGAMCVFGTDPDDYGNPIASAFAKVPGATATTSGQVFTIGPDAKVVADTKVVLLDPDTRKPVARTTTDTSGGFTFADVPVGHYVPVVVGPWKVVAYEEASFHVVRGRDYPMNIYVEPGPDVADPDSGELLPPPHGGNPPLTNVKGGGLATTGVSVVGLTAFGLLLVMAGAAMRGRRRPVLA